MSISLEKDGVLPSCALRPGSTLPPALLLLLPTRISGHLDPCTIKFKPNIAPQRKNQWLQHSRKQRK